MAWCWGGNKTLSEPMMAQLTDSYMHHSVSMSWRPCAFIWGWQNYAEHWLTHWGWVTHICVGKLTNIGSDNGLSPGRRQAIIWTNAGTLLIGPLGTYFSEILIEILTFSFKKMHLKMSSAKWRPFCLRLNELKLGVSSDRYNLSRSGVFRKGPFENWSLSGNGPSPNRGYPAKRAQSAMRKHGG